MKTRQTHSVITALALFVALLGSPRALAAHTGIGSGGDVVQAYVTETREQLKRALTQYLKPETVGKDQICANQGLSDSEAGDCAAFIATVAPEIQRLFSLKFDYPPLQVAAKALYVPDSSGRSVRVAAMTDTGPEGPIVFDYQLIAAYNPKLLFALLFHELGHKVPFSGEGNYVDDNTPVLSFSSGRRLLEAAGLALAEQALRDRMIYTNFAVLDRFDCTIAAEGQTAAVEHHIVPDLRRYLYTTAEDRFAAFEMGIGPGHLSQIGSTESVSLVLHEEKGCLGSADATRYTELSVSHQPPAPVSLNRIVGWNPACDYLTGQPAREITVHTGANIISCSYLGFIVLTQ